MLKRLRSEYGRISDTVRNASNLALLAAGIWLVYAALEGMSDVLGLLLVGERPRTNSGAWAVVASGFVAGACTANFHYEGKKYSQRDWTETIALANWQLWLLPFLFAWALLIRTGFTFEISRIESEFSQALIVPAAWLLLVLIPWAAYKKSDLPPVAVPLVGQEVRMPIFRGFVRCPSSSVHLPPSIRDISLGEPTRR
jgi:hypothetical protein